MSADSADLIRFFAFGLVWLFPIALIIAVLGFTNTPREDEIEDLGPNVVRFPEKSDPPAPVETTSAFWKKRLALRQPRR